jgi:hypothetical protein
MATSKAQLAFYSWTQVYDWIAETQNSWNFRSFSSFLNTVLMLWILLERHKLLDSTLSKLATLEGFTSVEELRESLGDRFGQTTVSNNDTTAKGLSD